MTLFGGGVGTFKSRGLPGRSTSQGPRVYSLVYLQFILCSLREVRCELSTPCSCSHAYHLLPCPSTRMDSFPCGTISQNKCFHSKVASGYDILPHQQKIKPEQIMSHTIKEVIISNIIDEVKGMSPRKSCGKEKQITLTMTHFFLVPTSSDLGNTHKTIAIFLMKQFCWEK